MTGPVLLDLFGCEGVIASGYAAAGFTVVSVDNDRARHMHNPYRWHLGDWRDGLRYALDLLPVTSVHASPPCPGHTRGNASRRDDTGVDPRHGSMIAEVRDALVATGLPYVRKAA